MWKKLAMVMLALTIAFSFSAVGVVDAAKSYSGGKKSFNSNTTPSQNSGVNKADPSTSSATKTPNAATNPTATKPGFFSGGLMKGLLIGGLAGMLFGGLFGNMGALGDILGLLVNVLAVVALVAVVIKIVQHFRNKRKFDEQPKRY
jgi:predicted lipid-binding transport protein (Tim44 family)